jgi:hypothetical protein
MVASGLKAAFVLTTRHVAQVPTADIPTMPNASD